ncbi:MAG: HAD-IC family P-type ATPase, partial [Candidatus Poseidoniaceae archaeon]
CSDTYEASEVTTIPGWGVKGIINGKFYSVGKGQDGIEVKQGDFLLGKIQVKDTIRNDASEALRFLDSVILSSGDNETEVSRVAEELNITDARSNQTPEDKLELIQSLSNVAMVGDGINDSAALAASDLGIAVSSATGVADISSDIVLTRDGLMTTIDALDLAGKTRRNIRQNLVWAFGYNMLALPIAMGALYHSHGLVLPPWFAAAAMSLSSMCVILNSIRLRWSFERGMARRRHGSRITDR